MTEKRQPMPLMNGSFEAGTCISYIESIDDEVLRDIARAELHYYSGQADEAARLALKYLDYEDKNIRSSALLITIFANLSLKNTITVQQCLKELPLKEINDESIWDQFDLMDIFSAKVANVLLHIADGDLSILKANIRAFPEGMQMFGCYLLAHDEYAKGRYERSLGILQMGAALCGHKYPVPMIYVYLAAAMNMIALRRTKKAQQYFFKAWEIAEKDGLIQPFIEHHTILGGLVETCINNSIDKYGKIIKNTNNFSESWIKVHNINDDNKVTDQLTATEFTIAMMAGRGWTNKEIAQQMGFSVHTAKHHMASIYQKLGISNRKQLKEYILS